MKDEFGFKVSGFRVLKIGIKFLRWEEGLVLENKHSKKKIEIASSRERGKMSLP